jgi:hypothetical protein
MRWLLIALLISVAGLLAAAAGTVRHILLHRKKPTRSLPESDAQREASDAESES